MKKKEQTREKILAAAARLFRARGFAGVTIADVMGACNLTHGGFYAHFSSKAELEAAVLENISETQRDIWFSGLQDMSETAQLSSLTSRYLSQAHRDHPEAGCPYAALANDVARHLQETPELTQVFAEALDKTVQRLQEDGVVVGRDTALAYLSFLVGGLTLSRALGDTPFSGEVIRASRAASLRISSRPHRT